MSTVPPRSATLSVLVSLRTSLDSEAYATRIAREPGFKAFHIASGDQPLGVPPKGDFDVRLLDRCGGSSSGSLNLPTLLLVDSEDPGVPRSPHAMGSGCACCRKFSRGSTWPRLFETLTSVVGRTPCTMISQDTGVASLTKREVDVLRLVGLGMTVNQCAEELGVSPSTVGNHKYRLMRKLDVKTSLQLLRIAVRNGLVDFD